MPHIVLDGDPASPKKGHSSPRPFFGPCHSIVAKRSAISATAEHLRVSVYIGKPTPASRGGLLRDSCQLSCLKYVVFFVFPSRHLRTFTVTT